MNKIKEVLSTTKGKIMTGGTALAVLIPTSMPLASPQSEAVSTALGTVASDITATLTAIAPVALTIVGAFLTWKYGVRFFKSLAK